MLERLILGDTLNFTTSVPDYLPSAGWTLKFRLIPRVSGTPIDITTSQDSTDSSLHRAQVSAATTAAAPWVAGVYSWASWVEKGSEKYSVDSGVMTLLADPRTASPLDSRTQARKALDDAKAALAAWTPTQQRYKIGEREMWFASQADIIKTVGFWQIEVKREENADRLAKGMASNRRIFLRLNRA